jgi:hypothetical protein
MSPRFVAFRPKADMTKRASHVRFRVQSGLAASDRFAWMFNVARVKKCDYCLLGISP